MIWLGCPGNGWLSALAYTCLPNVHESLWVNHEKLSVRVHPIEGLWLLVHQGEASMVSGGSWLGSMVGLVMLGFLPSVHLDGLELTTNVSYTQAMSCAGPTLSASFWTRFAHKRIPELLVPMSSTWLLWCTQGLPMQHSGDELLSVYLSVTRIDHHVVLCGRQVLKKAGKLLLLPKAEHVGQHWRSWREQLLRWCLLLQSLGSAWLVCWANHSSVGSGRCSRLHQIRIFAVQCNRPQSLNMSLWQWKAERDLGWNVSGSESNHLVLSSSSHWLFWEHHEEWKILIRIPPDSWLC